MSLSIKTCEMSMEEVQRDCREWAKKISEEFHPDLIIFIAKSGYLFAAPMAEYFECDMAEIIVSRPSNRGKDRIRKYIPTIPKSILFWLLKSKFTYAYHNKNDKREVKITDTYQRIDFSKHKKVLIVDDSVDTGWSMKKVNEILCREATHCEIRIAGYCVVSISEERIKVDFCRYKNTIVMTATSRYSSEYQKFLDQYENWRKENAD